MKLPGTYADDKENIHVIIETPYKSRNKFAYDEATGLFRLSKVIPTGMEFPCDMGFIPRTKGEDGDPLDALVLMDELTYPVCLVACRLLGAIKAEQKEPGKKAMRNDRFVAVPAGMEEYDHLQHLRNLNPSKMESIVHFFENYNKRENKEFRLLELVDAGEAHQMIREFKD